MDTGTLSHDIFVFVLGGPGAGKGTLCKNLSKKYTDFQHLSVGDVLRAEAADPDSEYAETIAYNMKRGTVGPMEITVELLRRAMKRTVARDARTVFLLDGKYLLVNPLLRSYAYVHRLSTEDRSTDAFRKLGRTGRIYFLLRLPRRNTSPKTSSSFKF